MGHLLWALVVLGLVVFMASRPNVMRGRGATIDGPEDLANMMRMAIGPAGPYLLWIAIFFAVSDNIATRSTRSRASPWRPCTRPSRSAPTVRDARARR